MTRLVALLLAALLSACATQAPPQPPAPPAPDIPADAPAVYSLDIRIDGDSRDNAALHALLSQNLDIARYRASEAALSRVELARLAAAAPAQAESLLETEGYFNAKADVDRDAADATKLVLAVKPGPLTRVDQLDIEFTEGLAEEDAKALRDSLRGAWPLKKGSAFTQQQWASGKSDLLLRARNGGYPLAHWGETAAGRAPRPPPPDKPIVLGRRHPAPRGAPRRMNCAPMASASKG